jgi:hypothetical protein
MQSCWRITFIAPTGIRYVSDSDVPDERAARRRARTEHRLRHPGLRLRFVWAMALDPLRGAA